MLYPARWKKITVDHSKVLKNRLYRLFRFLWGTRCRYNENSFLGGIVHSPLFLLHFFAARLLMPWLVVTPSCKSPSRNLSHVRQISRNRIHGRGYLVVVTGSASRSFLFFYFFFGENRLAWLIRDRFTRRWDLGIIGCFRPKPGCFWPKMLALGELFLCRGHTFA